MEIFTSLGDFDLQSIKYNSFVEIRNIFSRTYKTDALKTLQSNVNVLEIKNSDDKMVSVQSLPEVSKPPESWNRFSDEIAVFTVAEWTDKITEIHSTCNTKQIICVLSSYLVDVI